MTSMKKSLIALVLTLCLLCLPLAAAAETTPLDLMPTEEAGYTIVEGDGTVTLEDGKMTIVNNGDGDLRIWINYATPFDMTEYNTVQMGFDSEIPFKMAFHLISDADNTDDWLTTSTDYLDVFELDTATDRSPAGAYGVDMNIGDLAVNITDKSSVHFDQFILLMTGKGTFTVTEVKLANVPNPDADQAVSSDDADVLEEDADAPAPDSDKAENTDTDKTDTDESDKPFPVVPVVIIAVVVAVAAVVVIVIVKKKK